MKGVKNMKEKTGGMSYKIPNDGITDTTLNIKTGIMPNVVDPGLPKDSVQIPESR
jgi:hypothetical protein